MVRNPLDTPCDAKGESIRINHPGATVFGYSALHVLDVVSDGLDRLVVELQIGMGAGHVFLDLRHDPGFGLRFDGGVTDRNEAELKFTVLSKSLNGDRF